MPEAAIDMATYETPEGRVTGADDGGLIVVIFIPAEVTRFEISANDTVGSVTGNMASRSSAWR